MHAEPIADSDSDHDEEWHRRYYEHADSYKKLTMEVRTMASSSQPEPVASYDSEPLQGQGIICHLHGHESCTGLDIKSRCVESGCRCESLPLTGEEDDLDHERFGRFKARLMEDLAAKKVLGFVAGPPCETFIGGRFRTAVGPGRYGKTRKRKVGKVQAADEDDLAVIRMEGIAMELSASLATLCIRSGVNAVYHAPCLPDDLDSTPRADSFVEMQR